MRRDEKNIIEENMRPNKDRLEQLVKERKQITKSIGVIIGVFCVMIISMSAYICYYATVHKQTLFDNGYNGYQAQLQKKHVRGDIYAKDGSILAHTLIDEGGNEVREYPFEKLFSHVVGYSTKGKTGIEQLGNYYLVQSNLALSDRVSYEKNEEKLPGDSIYTTLDVQLQKIAYDSLGMYKGAVIVSEPSTGKILAMVSKPDFNPMTIRQDWDGYMADSSSSVLLNRVTQGLYPPGSTFKILTALEYMRENPEGFAQYRFQCNGHFTAGEHTIHCYHNSVHNQVDFTQSFAKSCNSSFANMGLTLDREAFADTLSDLLFQQKLPVAFPYKQSSVTIPELPEEEEMMQVVIGQGTDTMTPLHLHLLTNIIANDGILMEPYLMDRVENDSGQIIKQFEAKAVDKRFMTIEETTMLKQMMSEVVKTGTGKKLSGLSFEAAGKTGSAEYNGNTTDSHAWFTGFAPVENPEICVTVIIENAGSGGDYAVPIAKRIMEKYLE